MAWITKEQHCTLQQGSSTFFSPRTPWLRETLSRDPRRPKFGPDIHIFYLELSVSHTHTHTHKHTPLHMFEHNFFSPLQLAITLYSMRSEEHTSELQSHLNLVCRLLLG